MCRAKPHPVKLAALKLRLRSHQKGDVQLLECFRFLGLPPESHLPSPYLSYRQHITQQTHNFRVEPHDEVMVPGDYLLKANCMKRARCSNADSYSYLTLPLLNNERFLKSNYMSIFLPAGYKSIATHPRGFSFILITCSVNQARQDGEGDVYKVRRRS